MIQVIIYQFFLQIILIEKSFSIPKEYFSQPAAIMLNEETQDSII